MKKLIIAAIMFVASAVSSFATTYNFSGIDNGGLGSATMDISISGNTLTMILKNTSPTTLVDGSGINAPGITGFGFNLDSNNSVTNWLLTAYASQSATTPITIGSSINTSSYKWKLGTTQAGVTMDYLNYLKDIKGALYNPAATQGLSAKPNYFTDAILTMTFASAPVLDPTPDAIGSGLTGSEYVRMQSVGKGGSLKLTPEPTSTPVPEPSTILLLCAGLGGLAFWRRKGA